MAQMGFYFDMTICSGCKCCQIACKDVKDLAVGYLYRRATDYEGGTFPNVWAATLSMACNHCESPACMAVCPVEAIVKNDEDGLVAIDAELCIGCQSCVTACPYEAPSYNPETNKVSKCDGCLNFLEMDEKPACVAACSSRCLYFGELSELEATYGSAGLVRDLTILPDSAMTGPNFLIKTKQELMK
jgi:anaerobic dimethyl sulfoxide reductase subunit B (iron-sulfur subunit)